jgi:hypothetical protein
MKDIKEKLENIIENITEIKTDMAEMKVDVRHHIKRSDAHEDMILKLSITKERLLGAVGFIAFISTILAVIAGLNKVF